MHRSKRMRVYLAGIAAVFCLSFVVQAYAEVDSGRIAASAGPDSVASNARIVRDDILGKDVLLIDTACPVYGIQWPDGTEKDKVSSCEKNYLLVGPGGEKQEEDIPEHYLDVSAKSDEVNLGWFIITGYCVCEECTGEYNLTYSGTVPRAGYTLAADLDMFPIGTRLKIGEIVYTVEDKGGGIKGRILDVFYDTHEAAVENGRYMAEVFLVEAGGMTQDRN